MINKRPSPQVTWTPAQVRRGSALQMKAWERVCRMSRIDKRRARLQAHAIASIANSMGMFSSDSLELAISAVEAVDAGASLEEWYTDLEDGRITNQANGLTLDWLPRQFSSLEITLIRSQAINAAGRGSALPQIGSESETEPQPEPHTSEQRLLDPSIRRIYPSASQESLVATARGVIDPGLQPPQPHANERFDGEVHLSNRAIYFVYEGPTFPSPRVVRMANEDLRDWKHMEMDDVDSMDLPMEVEGVVAIEFATDRYRLSAMLHRSATSDPDALIEFGRSVQDVDLLGEGILARTIVYDWEKRRTSTSERHARAAAELVDRVAEADPGVFIEIATRLATMTADDRTSPDEDTDEMTSMLDQIVEESGYVDARARVLAS